MAHWRFEWRVGVIREVGDDYALVVDDLAKEVQVPLDLTGKGVLPAVGEWWVLSHLHGGWRLHTCLHATRHRHTITGSRTDGTALANLLSELETMGLIEDGTSA